MEKIIIQRMMEYVEQNQIHFLFEQKPRNQLYVVYRLALNNIKKGVVS